MGNFTRKDVWAVIIISFVPATIGMLRYFLVDDTHYGNEADAWTNFFIGTLYSLIITSSLYFGCMSILFWLNNKMPWKDNVGKRIVVELGLMFTYSTVVQFLIIFAFSRSVLFDEVLVNVSFYFENILFGNTITLVVITIVEGVYFFRNWKESLLLAEKMKRENMESQLNSLRSQLDPHFLFNSLNVLASLIKKDTSKAEEFVEDFANVYRYVLDVKDEMVVTLSSELKFLESYVSLQRIRFGDAFQVRVNINPRPMTLYIPPLCLHELITNAVKHNEVSLENKLLVEIYNKGDNLVVRNNVKSRNEQVSSTAVGLENIAKRYTLLTDKATRFEMLDNHFEAEVPLLEIEE
ncbi:sensor histidine kinase [Owenweeksia hongkongensis]|uniref:sensor histidine kinase n=1 Tax=Owenweeksia hongkongensis TaxID=253245 RepID=UPI003A93B6B7